VDYEAIDLTPLANAHDDIETPGLEAWRVAPGGGRRWAPASRRRCRTGPTAATPRAAPSSSRTSRSPTASPRVPLAGGTDKMSNGVPIGLSRTYARLGQRLA
jgi:hypothetical protein